MKKDYLIFLSLFLFWGHYAFAQNNLFYNNGSEVTIQSGGILYIQGGLTNESNSGNNGIFHNNGIIYVKNDWINEVNNGAMDSLTGTVNLFGDNQFIDGSFTTTFNNLTLSGTGTKTLNINTIVGGSSGILSLNDRPLDLNKKTLTITNPIASTITRTSGYIISESNSSVGYGMVYWRCANTIGNYTVPFGSFAADYIPFTFNISTAGNNAGIKNSGIMAATYPTNTSLATNNRPLPIGVLNFLNNCQSEHDKRANDRFWHLADSNYTASPLAQLSFSYIEPEWNISNGSLNTINEGDLKIWNYVNANWQSLNTTLNTATNNASSTAALNKFVPYVLAERKDLIGSFIDTTWIRCYGESNGQAFVSGTNGYGTNTYSWSNGFTGDSILNGVPTGTYSVNISDEQGCDTTINGIFIDQPQPLTINVTSTDTICYGASTTISVISSGGNSGYTYTWDGINGSNSYTTSFTATDSVTLSANDSKGCNIDTSIRVNVRLPLTINAFADVGICKGDTALIGASYINNYGNVTYTWSNTQNVNPVYVSPSDTTSYVVTGSDLCGTSPFSADTIMVNVYALPQVEFSNTSVCAGNAVQFSSLSTVASGNVTQYFYDFDNDGTWETNQPIASFTFANGGSYTVNHLAISSMGCRDSFSRLVYVNYLPVSDFIAQNQCVYNQVQLQSSSSVAGNHSITTYSWVTGDGNQLSNNNQTYLYNNCGNYTITHIVTTDSGCTSSISKPITIYCKPVSNFTVNSSCSYNMVQFNGTGSSVNNGSINNYAWDLNYTNNLNLQNGTSTNSQLYPAGSYTAALVVTSNQGCRDTTFQNFTVYPKPTANFTASNDCVNKQICFTNSSSVSSGAINGYSWDLNNDGVFESTISNPCNTYASSGNISIKLIVTSDQNCKDTLNKDITLYPEPLPNFSTSGNCLGDLSSFANVSSISSGIINSYSWNFGDGQTSALPSPDHLYAGDNIYNVCLTATSDNNCTKSLCKNIFIYPKPKASFTASVTSGCDPLGVNFINTSSITATNPNMPAQNVQYSWNFGDGTSTTNSSGNTSNTYLTGTYNVYLLVTSNNGCTDDTLISNLITAHPTPKANFDYTPQQATVFNSIVDLIDRSERADSIYYQPFWGDEFTGLIAGAPYYYQYADTGTYAIMQIATTSFGCSDTIIKNVYVGPEWVFYIPNAFSPNEDGINDLFLGKGIGIDMKSYQMLIFNRWGEEIYSEKESFKGWNGNIKNSGKEAPIDVYIYKVIFRDQITNNVHEYNNSFSLIR
jgi:gliding motility-associated-like protein